MTEFIRNLKSPISNLQSQIRNLKFQISNLKSQIRNLKFEISNFRYQIFLCVLCASAVPSASVADGPELADLGAYRAAISARPDPSAPLVTFRELWDHPESRAGRVVRVEGTVARIFRQGGLGEFPPLVETWIKSTAGDPFCLVFPEGAGGGVDSTRVGARVQFSGTFLRQIHYRGGDSERIAPLIVGPGAPKLVLADRAEEDGRSSWSTADWLLGLGASVVIVGVLARRHLGRPGSGSGSGSGPSRIDPEPSFIDGEPADISEGGIES